MAHLTIPPNNQLLMPYLILQDVPAFEAFVGSVFNARIIERMLREDQPDEVMHGEILIEEQATIMYGQSSDAFSVQTAGLFVYVADAHATVAKAVAAGAQVILPVEDKPYGRMGGLLDPCGNTWWVNQQLA